MTQPTEIRGRKDYDRMDIAELCKPISAHVVPMKACFAPGGGLMSEDQARGAQRQTGIDSKTRQKGGRK